MTRPAVLSIAGSDSGGGAGVQADLRVFSRLGTFGTTALTALTAQNLQGVHDVCPVPKDHVVAQIEAVLGGFSVVAVKTGMLWSAEIVESVAAIRANSDVAHWVVDPVMVATSGGALLQQDAIDAYQRLLLPAATLITPNLDEAAVLLDWDRIGRDDMDRAARALEARFGSAVLLKGGHLEGDPVDLLVDGDAQQRWSHSRRHAVNTHGSGCMLSAALTAHLAHGFQLRDACELSLAFLQRALAEPHRLASGESVAGIEKGEGEDPAMAPVI